MISTLVRFYRVTLLIYAQQLGPCDTSPVRDRSPDRRRAASRSRPDLLLGAGAVVVAVDGVLLGGGGRGKLFFLERFHRGPSRSGLRLPERVQRGLLGLHAAQLRVQGDQALEGADGQGQGAVPRGQDGHGQTAAAGGRGAAEGGGVVVILPVRGGRAGQGGAPRRRSRTLRKQTSLAAAAAAVASGRQEELVQVQHVLHRAVQLGVGRAQPGPDVQLVFVVLDRQQPDVPAAEAATATATTTTTTTSGAKEQELRVAGTVFEQLPP